MTDRPKHIETLARIAAQLAGRHPDEHLRIQLADVIVFDGKMWRYPDFLARAEIAYETLSALCLDRPVSLDGHRLPSNDDFGSADQDSSVGE